MEVIIQHSQLQSTKVATRLWSIASTQYPKKNKLLLEFVTAEIIEALDIFALSTRRIMEHLPKGQKIPLNSKRWQWEPSTNMLVVNDLWDALNHIIHAKVLKVGFEELPSAVSIIDGGTVVIPYVLAETDRRNLAYIDPFAVAHAFFYQLLPIVQGKSK